MATNPHNLESPEARAHLRAEQPPLYVVPSDAREFPDDAAGSLQNQHTTGILALATSDDFRTKIVVKQAQDGELDLSNPHIYSDIARQFDEDTAAKDAVNIARYDNLGRGRLARTERFVRRLVQPSIRSAIKDDLIRR